MSQPCPSCGHDDVHHSRFRGWIERVRFNVTGRLPFRCHQCNWRGWCEDTAPPGESLREVHKQLTDDELEDLDPESGHARPRRRR